MITREQQRNFISEVVPFAQEAYLKTGILASILIGCSAIESTWGTDSYVKKANNYFCSFGSYNGQSYVERDKNISFSFKKYSSGVESFIDYGRNLRNKISLHDLTSRNFEDFVKILSVEHEEIFIRTLLEIEKRYNITQYDIVKDSHMNFKIIEEKSIKKTRRGNWQIRKNPDSQSEWVGILLGGKEYSTEGYYKDWIKVKKGWVQKEAFDNDNQNRKVRIKKNPCWIYSKPDYFSLKLKEYNGPDLVEYLAISKGWYKIKEGWLSPTSIE